MTHEDNFEPGLTANDPSINEASPLLLENEYSERTRNPPKDDYNKVYIVFFLLGMGTLLPWNFFISLNSFWDYKFRNVSAENLTSIVGEEEKTDLQKQFASMLAIASNVPNAIFVILNVWLGQKVELRKRIFFSLGFILSLFVVVTALAKADSDHWQRPFLVLILIFVVVININSAIFQGGIFGVAGKFPPRYISAAMAGQAVGGIFPALVDVFVTLVRVREQDVGFACFTIATAVLMVCLMAFYSAYKTSFFQYYYLNSASEAEPEMTSSGLSGMTKLKLVFKHSWQYCLSVYLTFCVTLSVFPAVTALVESQFLNTEHPSWWATDFFVTVCCFLLFNIGDLTGRCLASWIKMPGSGPIGRAILLLSALSRVVFIPLFMYCNAAPGQRRLPVVFRSDADYVMFMIFFSVSNGYLGNLCMILGPKTSVSSELQETTAMVLVACLVLGTGSGSFLSYPITKAI